MSEKETGGSAFPLSTVRYDDGLGMTLRDYFAAKAMQSLVAGEKWLSCSDMPLAAELAYKMANAMLEARK